MRNTLEAFWASVVRTITPVVVGSVVSIFTSLGIEPDEKLETTLAALIFATSAAIWHIAIRLLETCVSPRFGWLLGYAKRPEYAEAPPKARPHG